ncbi:DUF4230 domain-containing protein [filamentous cyanobacterium CCP5]|nr:DUF4230 domain-containing protein [filamentous cyanobacterium CCP5]
MRTAPPKHKPPRQDGPEDDRSRYQPGVDPSAPPPINPLGFVKTVTRTLVSGALVAGLLVGVGVWRGGDRFLEGLRLMVLPPQPEPQVDVKSVIVQQLRGASELTTAIFAMEAVVPTRSDRTIAGYVVGSTNLLYIAYGEVRAGVDLSQVSASNIRLLEDDSSVAITLPPPQILDSKLDLNRSDVYDYDRGFLGLGPDTAPELQRLAQQEALVKIEQAACQEGLLQEAQQRAETTVSQLLATAGFETVQVTTQPSNGTCETPPSNSGEPGSAPFQG